MFYYKGKYKHNVCVAFNASGTKGYGRTHQNLTI